jgi:ribosomal protein L37AE/L43A
MHSIRYCFLAFLLIVWQGAFAKKSSFSGVEILIEDGFNYKAEELLVNKEVFQPFNYPEITNEKKSFWIKFKYRKPHPDKVYYLHYPTIVFRKLELYYFVGDMLCHHKSGFGVPLEKRSLFLPNSALPLPTTNDSVTCLLHIESFNGYFFYFSESDSRDVFKNEIKSTRVEYFIIGLGCLSILFSLIFFIHLSERLYLYYALFSSMIVLSRLVYSGYIFDYLSYLYPIASLKPLLNLFTITYDLINIFLILYFYEYLKYHQRSKRYFKIFCFIIIVRVGLLLIHISTSNETLLRIVDNHWFDLFVQIFLVVIAIRSSREYIKLNILAILSLALLIVGNLQYILRSFGMIPLQIQSYYIFINLEALEIIIFALSIGYRNNYLKMERNSAVQELVDSLRKSEQLKDDLNKELEIKVADRTRQIQEMNDLLKFHNIELKSEVKIANESRVFQKNMDFLDFQKIFPDDKSCYEYLAKLKWKDKENIVCKKCGSNSLNELENHAFRCRKCGWVESVTNGTLFHKVRFSIQKAFYITYLSSLKSKDAFHISNTSKEIELRVATVWAFKQKVEELIVANQSKKKNKDGWSHLIEYSIKSNR